MAASHRRVPVPLILTLGVLLGCVLSQLPGSGPVARAQAGGSDHEMRIRELEKRLTGESIVTSGPIALGYDHGKKVQIPLDALYYLDYRRALLRATVPTIRQSVGPTKVIDRFAARDLIADFKIDTEKVPNPRFRMATGSLGTYSDGCAPLYVFETVTNQVAVYRLSQHTIGTVTTPKFELLEISSIDDKTAGVAVR